MIITFENNIKGQPTNFVEKILSGEKKHTIRRDFADRWAAEDLMHMVSGLGTKERETFCSKHVAWIQYLRISHVRTPRFPDHHHIYFYIDGKPFGVVKNMYGTYSVPSNIAEFIKNDGFDSAADFFNWFDGNYNGKIIGWDGNPYRVEDSMSVSATSKKHESHA